MIFEIKKKSIFDEIITEFNGKDNQLDEMNENAGNVAILLFSKKIFEYQKIRRY